MEIGGEAKKYIEAHNINIESTTKNYLQNWINNVQFFIKNQSDFKEEDIRKFLVAKKGNERKRD